METKELMIGDKVMVKVLSQIPDTYVLHTWTANDYSRDIQVKPIPLTSEILEKNGFAKVNTQRYEWTGSNGYYVNVNPQKKMWHINGANGSNVNQYFLIVGFNVHRFQQALRLCGLIDLADNFKV